ncbi:HSP20-like chaperone [Microthyrium microscopicum]|uniref:HSP20-like chaperone n=1 Tax=Microthyrium microscopicum TaxID=703497 RepID=A0A6A6U668_9PEZI|nr:HSP20-like chaperone [Microthyrium microscopicum]
MASSVHPEVLWAQRSSTSDPEKNYVYLTITAPDVPKSDLKLDIEGAKLSFSGKSKTKGLTYAIDIEFFDEVDPAESKINHTDKNIEMVLRKKDLKEEFWPRLLKDKAKVHWLKTDFDKWVDEDEQDPEQDEDYMQKAGGLGGDGGFEGIDFSKFGAGPGGPGGMPGMEGMEGLEGMGDEEDEDDDDDDEMPALEGEETAGKAHPGIEEVE